MTEHNQTNSQEKYLTSLDVWAMAFGCMVGWGAFVMPGSTFLPVAGPAGTIISMVIGLVVMLVIGSCISFLMTRSSGSGGIYVYTKEALGRDHAFLCSWFLCLSYLTIVFLNGTALFLVIRAVLGDAAHRGYSYAIAGKPVYVYEVLLSVAALAGVGFLFLVAKKLLKRLATVLAVILLAGIVVTTAACLPHADPHDIFMTFGYEDVSRGFGIFSLVILAPWAFVGFEVVTFAASHFTFPAPKTKRVITTAIIIAALAYTFLTLVSVSIIPEGYTSWQAYIADLGKLNGIVSIPSFYAAKKTMGTTGLVLVVVTAMAAILTGIIGAYRATVSLLSTMAGDKILSERFLKPGHCILFVMILSVFISFLGRNSLVWFIDLTAFGAIVAYGYTSAAAYKIAKTQNNYRIMAAGLLGIVSSVLFGIAQIVPCMAAVDAMCSEAFLLLSLWCLLGFVFYWRMVRRSTLAEYSSMASSGLALFTLLLYTALMWLGKLLMAQKDLESLHRALITGGIALMVIVFVGLTVMLYIQNRVSKMHEAARRERIRLAEGSLARSQFLLNMSHDIRPPMNAVVNYAKLALKEPDGMLRDYLRRIEKSGLELKTIIDGIFEATKSGNDEFDLELDPTDLSLSFEELNDLFSEEIKRKRVNFSVHVSLVRNRYVWCDGKDFKQILSDIVSRACRRTPEGGAVSASICETGSGENGYSTYELRFQNSGPGLSREEAAKLFTADAPLEGADPGLAGTKEIIDRMGGAAEVFSSPGKGTEVVLRFKFRLAREKDMKKKIAVEKSSGK